MSSFPKTLVILDVIVVLLRLLFNSISSVLKGIASGLGRIPFVGKVISAPFKFLASFVGGFKTLLTVLLVLLLVVTVIYIIRWIKAKRDWKNVKQVVKNAENSLERVPDDESPSSTRKMQSF